MHHYHHQDDQGGQKHPQIDCLVNCLHHLHFLAITLYVFLNVCQFILIVDAVGHIIGKMLAKFWMKITKMFILGSEYPKFILVITK